MMPFVTQDDVLHGIIVRQHGDDGVATAGVRDAGGGMTLALFANAPIAARADGHLGLCTQRDPDRRRLGPDPKPLTRQVTPQPASHGLRLLILRMTAIGALRNWRGAAQFLESKDKPSRRNKLRHWRIDQ